MATRNHAFCLKNKKVVRKSIHKGLYLSINESPSFFIQPFDVLIKLDCEKTEEYILFPKNWNNDIKLVKLICKYDMFNKLIFTTCI